MRLVAFEQNSEGQDFATMGVSRSSNSSAAAAAALRFQGFRYRSNSRRRTAQRQKHPQHRAFWASSKRLDIEYVRYRIPGRNDPLPSAAGPVGRSRA